MPPAMPMLGGWTFRQSRRSMVSTETRRAVIVAEVLHDAASRDIGELLDSLAGSITDLWTAPRKKAILNADAPKLDF